MPPRRREQRPRVVLCAALTLDGKLADDPLTVPSALYGGDADSERHPWAKLYDEAAAILVDDRLHASLPFPQAAAQPVIKVSRHALHNTQSWPGEFLEAVRRLQPAGTHKSILCFGGAELFRASLDAGLVTELALIVCPRVDGRLDAPTLSGPPGADWFPASLACRLVRMEMRGGECLLRYRLKDNG